MTLAYPKSPGRRFRAEPGNNGRLNCPELKKAGEDFLLSAAIMPHKSPSAWAVPCMETSPNAGLAGYAQRYKKSSTGFTGPGVCTTWM